MANEHRQERIEEEVMEKLIDGSDAALHAHNERLQAHGQVESGTYYRYVDSEPEHHNDFLTTYDDVVAEVDSDAPTRTLWSDAWGRLKKNRLAIIGACWIIFMVVIALTADLWAQQLLGSPTEIDTAQAAAQQLQPPSLEHPFGTDALGRDVLVRVIYGARVSLSVGIIATAISTVIGLVMGAIAAFYGGIWDTLIMRLADIFLAFPYTLFVIAMLAVIGSGIQNVFIAIGILGWPSIARVFRQGERLRRRGPGHGRLRRPHHHPPHLPELRGLHRRLRDDEHRRRHPHRERALVPRHGRRPARALLGPHDPGRTAVPGDRAVAHAHARHRHPHHGARLHPAR